MRDEVEPESDETEFKVADRRHWAAAEPDTEGGNAESDVRAISEPPLVEAYRQRAEAAEAKLQEYIEAFKKFKDDQESFRQRTERDVERRVDLRFGELVGVFVDSIDDLDLALSHAGEIQAAQPLAEGVRIARKRILGALEQQGVQQFSPQNELFDPNDAEALRVDAVQRRELDGTVTEVLQPGYRLGGLVIRPARVAVARYSATAD